MKMGRLLHESSMRPRGSLKSTHQSNACIVYDKASQGSDLLHTLAHMTKINFMFTKKHGQHAELLA